jgi:hypothetical protein
VIDKPDDMFEEVPVAFVVALEPSAELEALILGRCKEALSKFKCPKEPVGLKRYKYAIILESSDVSGSHEQLSTDQS